VFYLPVPKRVDMHARVFGGNNIDSIQTPERGREIDDDGECEEERGGDCDRDRPTTTMI
jgi:hypothetical protein